MLNQMLEQTGALIQVRVCSLPKIAERPGQLDRQPLAAHSVGVLIGRPPFIAGK